MSWNWRKLRRAIGGRCLSGSAWSSEQEQDTQQLSTTQKSSTSTCSDVVQSLSSGRRISANNPKGDDDIRTVETPLKRETPVLFCTSRGLHLRVARPFSNTVVSTTDSTSMRATTSGSNRQHIPTASAYEIRFCDLERWSTNRANTVSLEDTFTVTPRNTTDRQLETIHSSGQSGDSHNSFALPMCRQSMSLATRSNNNNRGCSIQNTFARFGLE